MSTTNGNDAIESDALEIQHNVLREARRSSLKEPVRVQLATGGYTYVEEMIYISHTRRACACGGRILGDLFAWQFPSGVAT